MRGVHTIAFAGAATDSAAAAALHALGVVALAAGDAGRAAGLLGEAALLAGGVAAEEAVARRLPGDLIEALGRIADAPALRSCAWRLRSLSRRTASPRVRGWAAHAAGLAAGSEGDPRAALAELETALHCAELAGDPFELGRVLLTCGQSERRLRRKRAAGAAFERAIRLFVECGTEAWAARARAELARVAGARRPGQVLTVTERRACERAAEGRSNAEIAAELYVSRRTIEVNLARAYVKLGIRNRAQVGAALRGKDAGQASTTAEGDAARALRSAVAALGSARGQPPASDLFLAGDGVTVAGRSFVT